MAQIAWIARTWKHVFPERQLLIRSHGKVRYLPLNGPVQAGLALGSVLLLAGFVVSAIGNRQAAESMARRDSRIAEITSAYDRLSQNMLTIKNRYGDVAGDRERSQRQLAELNRQRDSLQKRLNTQTATLDRANAELSRATEERKLLHQQIVELRGQLQLTEGERGRLADNLDNLASELEHTARQRDAERQQRERLAGSLASLRGRLDDVEATRGSLEAAVAERDQLLSSLTEERNGAERRQQQLAQLLNDMHQQMSGVESARMELESVLSDQAGQVTNMRQERDKALEGNQTLSRRVASLEAHLTDVRQMQQDVLQRIRLRTDAGIKTLEAVVAMTGLKLGPLLDRAEADGTGVGGPLVLERRVPVGVDEDKAAADSVEEALASLETRLNRWSAMHQILAHLPIVAPVNHYRVSSPFGRRKDPFNKKKALHSGVDLASAKHTRVYSTSPGVVTYSGWKGPYGRMVEIDHGFGLKTRYGHLARITVKKGAKVGHRERIGLMGSTGRSTGIHVHYEVLFDGKPLNPMKFLEAGRHVFKQG